MDPIKKQLTAMQQILFELSERFNSRSEGIDKRKLARIQNLDSDLKVANERALERQFAQVASQAQQTLAQCAIWLTQLENSRRDLLSELATGKPLNQRGRDVQQRIDVLSERVRTLVEVNNR